MSADDSDGTCDRGADGRVVYLLAPAAPPSAVAAMGLYWPATGLALLHGLPGGKGTLALSSSTRRSPIDDRGCTAVGRRLAPGTLLVLTTAGRGPQSVLALLELVPVERPPPDPRADPVEPASPIIEESAVTLPSRPPPRVRQMNRAPATPRRIR